MFKNSRHKNPLISFEGIDKSGKGTQSRLLAQKIRGTRIAFPRYETPLGKIIRRHLDGEVALRSEHVIDSSDPERDGLSVYPVDEADAMVFQCLMATDKVSAQGEIAAALEKGPVVLDRYLHSALAYGVADGLDEDWIRWSHVGTVAVDAVFILDVPVDVALSRGRAAGDDRTKHDRYERDLTKMQAVRANYWRLAETYRDPIYIIDGQGHEGLVMDSIWTILRGLKLV